MVTLQEQHMSTYRAHSLELVGKASSPSRSDLVIADAESRWTNLGPDAAKSEIFDAKARANASAYQCNIESYIGTVSTPVGIASTTARRSGTATRNSLRHVQKEWAPAAWATPGG